MISCVKSAEAEIVFQNVTVILNAILITYTKTTACQSNFLNTHISDLNRLPGMSHF